MDRSKADKGGLMCVLGNGHDGNGGRERRKNGCGRGEHVPLAPESYKPHYYYSDVWYCRRFVVFGAWLCVSSGMDVRVSGTGNVWEVSRGISKSSSQRRSDLWAVCLAVPDSMRRNRSGCSAASVQVAIPCASCRLRGSGAAVSSGYRRDAGICDVYAMYAMLYRVGSGFQRELVSERC